LHQWPLYPGTGLASERGLGEGEGATLNLPQPPHAGDREWLTAFASWRLQVGIASLLLFGYWLLLLVVPVPGAGAGVLTPTGNLASFVDRALLGGHLLTPSYDPEGLLSTLPAIATALCGVFAGDWLKAPRARHRSLWLFIAGVVATVVGLGWGRLFPINKNLWTSSFAMFSAGLAAQALAACHWLIDTVGWRAWSRPFSAYGRNPLAAYFLSVGFDSVLTNWLVGGGESLKGFLYRATFASWLRPPEAASLAYAIAYVVLWAVVLTGMYRRRIFIGI